MKIIKEKKEKIHFFSALRPKEVSFITDIFSTLNLYINQMLIIPLTEKRQMKNTDETVRI